MSGTNTLSQPTTALAPGSTGTGDVIGNLSRTGTFGSTTVYAFGNPNNQLALANGTRPTPVVVRLVKAVPAAKSDAVARTYTITPTGGTGYTATVRLHYLDSELNGNAEGGLELWHLSSGVWSSQGKTSNDTTANYVEKTGVLAGTLAGDWALAAGDTTPPILQNVTSSATDGTKGIATVIPIQVVYNENVVVTGTPQLTLTTGPSATTTLNYTSGSGTSTLVFNYTVAAGDASADLDYADTASLNLNGGTIKDSRRQRRPDRPRVSPALPGSLGANRNLVIETVQPTVTNVTSSLGDGSYGLGQVVPIQVTFSEPVTVTGHPADHPRDRRHRCLRHVCQRLPAPRH